MERSYWVVYDRKYSLFCLFFFYIDTLTAILEWIIVTIYWNRYTQTFLKLFHSSRPTVGVPNLSLKSLPTIFNLGGCWKIPRIMNYFLPFYVRQYSNLDYLYKSFYVFAIFFAYFFTNLSPLSPLQWHIEAWITMRRFLVE